MACHTLLQFSVLAKNQKFFRPVNIYSILILPGNCDDDYEGLKN